MNGLRVGRFSSLGGRESRLSRGSPPYGLRSGRCSSRPSRGARDGRAGLSSRLNLDGRESRSSRGSLLNGLRDELSSRPNGLRAGRSLLAPLRSSRGSRDGRAGRSSRLNLDGRESRSSRGSLLNGLRDELSSRPNGLRAGRSLLAPPRSSRGSRDGRAGLSSRLNLDGRESRSSRGSLLNGLRAGRSLFAPSRAGRSLLPPSRLNGRRLSLGPFLIINAKVV